MRPVSIFAFIFPALVASQITCDTGDALCCFDVEDATQDNLAQLTLIRNTSFPSTSVGSIGLLCTALDDTCTTKQVCCTDNNYDGVTALGCTVVFDPDATTDSDSDTTDTTDTTDSASK